MDSANGLWRYGAVFVSLAMFLFVVVKAQGCQRPIDAEADEPEVMAEPETSGAASEAGTAEAEGSGVPTAHGAEEPSAAPDAGDDPDVGTVGGELKPGEVFPATKAGPVRVLPEAKPEKNQKKAPARQQQAAPQQ